MNNKLKWIILAAALVLLLAAAGLLYNKFSDKFATDNLFTGETSAETTPAPTPEVSEESAAESSEENSKENSAESSEQEYQPAPDFVVYDYDGNEVKLSDYKCEPVVLNFWATWCYYCMEEMPDFNKASLNHPEVRFLMVNATDGVQETLENAKEYIDSNDYNFTAVYDTQLNAVYAYGLNSFPATFFINADGELVAYGKGMMGYDTLEKGIGMITE